MTDQQHYDRNDAVGSSSLPSDQASEQSGETRWTREQYQQFSGLAVAAPFYLLPQREYIAKRRYQPESPIVFRTTTTGYVSLLDAMNGNLAQLLDADVSVFSGDNLSQKQSIRLEIVELKSFERQINVRNPANHTHSITRSKLAEKVAKEIFDYMKRQQSFGDPAFGLGPGTQGFERLVLLELRHVSRSSWQPVLGVRN
ncbi:uncharacterized protein BXZ73DRAFT_95757 [Epithele typhae]|uniref:uncharacterized protein n=1 Tax=Epithele typhae TaxID=378194 RepID=UPI00200875BD|nr:uncharacterized protein BXZ73DRAFT_95757 [Epithele typhae]KAH9946255.1 hypothetical protein BXZ73DRAFT_95757 [Epithele typhae]